MCRSMVRPLMECAGLFVWDLSVFPKSILRRKKPESIWNLKWRHWNFSGTLYRNIRIPLNCSKVTVETFRMLQNVSFFQIIAELLNFSSKNPKIIQQPEEVKLLIIIINVSWSSDPHFRVICEGSCDTEDWSNHRKKIHCCFKL